MENKTMSPEKKLARLEKFQLIYGICSCVLLALIIAGLLMRGRGTSAQETTPTLLESQIVTKTERNLFESTSEAMASESAALVAHNVPVWQRLKGQEISSPEEKLIFSLDGEMVTEVSPDTEYFAVSRELYENFVPRTLDDLILLQLPETTFKPTSEFSGFVLLAAPWKVPADIESELKFQIDTHDGSKTPAGEWVNGPITVWMVPWEYAQ